VRHWLETGQTLPAIAEAKPASKTAAKAKPVADKRHAKRATTRA
jgi:hypothetical protein